MGGSLTVIPARVLSAGAREESRIRAGGRRDSRSTRLRLRSGHASRAGQRQTRENDKLERLLTGVGGLSQSELGHYLSSRPVEAAHGMAVYWIGMARTSIKSTYALDVETIRKLDRVAARWKVSKSEVLRRAIDVVARDQFGDAPPPLRALDELQKSVKLTRRRTDQWSREVRNERAKTSARHEWRKR